MRLRNPALKEGATVKRPYGHHTQQADWVNPDGTIDQEAYNRAVNFLVKRRREQVQRPNYRGQKAAANNG